MPDSPLWPHRVFASGPRRVFGAVLVVTEDFAQPRQFKDFFQPLAVFDLCFDFSTDLVVARPGRRSFEREQAFAVRKTQAKNALRFAQREVREVKQAVALKMPRFDKAKAQLREPPLEGARIADLQLDLDLLTGAHGWPALRGEAGNRIESQLRTRAPR